MDEGRGYEHRDINVRAVALFGAALTASLAVIALGLAWVYGRAVDQARSRAPKPLPVTELRRTPPEPRLEVHPTLSYRELHAAQKRLLENYDVVDPAAGVYRIPIAQAMELLLRKGEGP